MPERATPHPGTAKPERAKPARCTTEGAKPEPPKPEPGKKPDPPTPDPLALTSATVLSPSASVELRGRSLLPPPPRSLLREASVNRFAMPTPLVRPARRVEPWIILAVLLAASLAVTMISPFRRAEL